MTGEHAGSAGGRGGPEWPMPPGVPGSAHAREARTIVGVSPMASDSEFIGASPAEGRDALVAAARRRLEPVMASYGFHSRESWLVDHELKSALGRLLALMPPERARDPGQTPIVRTPPVAPPVRASPPATPATPASPASPASAAANGPAARAPAVPRVAIAAALYLRRHPLGRSMLGRELQMRRVGTDAPGARSDEAAVDGTQLRDAAGDADASADATARARAFPRARTIAATIAVLSAIGLVIEVAYVPVHLRRSLAKQPAVHDGGQDERGTPSRARSTAGEPPATPTHPPSALNAAPSGQIGESTADSPARETGQAAALAPPPAPRPAPLPAPAIPAEVSAEGPQRAASASPQSIDPTLRQRLDRMTEQWMARVRSSIEAAATVDGMDAGAARWLEEARLLERLVALDDIAQLLIDARADDAEPLLDVMPVPCNLASTPPEPPVETSSREDGRLVTDLSRAGGGGESRLAVLRAYRSLPLAPGRADARALVSESIGGPSRNSRALALAILLERGTGSVAVLEAVHARVNELTATPAGRAVVAQLAGETPGGAPLDAQSLRARLARKILEGRGAPMHLIDATADATAAMLDRMARRADPQVAPADIESSISTLARAASRDAAPARLDGANGPLQRMVASLSALHGARIVRNYRRFPDERARIDLVADAASARILSSRSSLGQAIEAVIGLLAQDCITLAAQDLPHASDGPDRSAGGARASSNPLLLPAPEAESLARWPEAARALDATGAAEADGDALIRIAEDVQDSSEDADSASLAARLYARAALVGNEATAASAARGIASLVSTASAAGASERHRWESVAAQYAMADAAMKGMARSQRRAGLGVDVEADASSRVALADALALCVSGYGRQASDRLQAPTVRALAERISGALPGGIAGIETLCDGRTPAAPPLEPGVADQLLAVEAALREPRSTRWSDDLALRRGLPLVSIDTASRAARVSVFTPAPDPGPR